MSQFSDLVQSASVYTGVGSRETPDRTLNLIQKLASSLAQENLFLRTGDARGADEAFSIGASETQGPQAIYGAGSAKRFSDRKDGYDYLDDLHPTPEHLSSFVRDLMARNAHQVLGDELDRPSDFLVCWTPDGVLTQEGRGPESGGTGHTIGIASENDVPVFNLKLDHHRKQVTDFLQPGGPA